MRYREVLQTRLEEISRQRADKKAGRDPRAFIPTGLKELDHRGGIKRGVLTIYGAATGEGKSLLKLHFATSAARAGYKVCILDWEDPLELTADRTLSTMTAINNADICALDLTDKQATQLSIAADEADWADNIEIYDGLVDAPTALSMVDRSEAELVLIDYLQGLPEGDSGLERTIANFCWDLNKWAQNAKAGVVAFSQVSRAVEERGLKRFESGRFKNPDNVDVDGFRPFGSSDLAWCGAAGQRAKELGFLFRPNRYRRRFGENVPDNVLELSFPKRNYGEEGTIKIGFDPRAARLYDLGGKK